jgi:hypothetical protein
MHCIRCIVCYALYYMHCIISLSKNEGRLPFTRKGGQLAGRKVEVVFHLPKRVAGCLCKTNYGNISLRSSSFCKNISGCLPFTEIFEVVFPLQKKKCFKKPFLYFMHWILCNTSCCSPTLKLEVVFHIKMKLRSSSIYQKRWGRLPVLTNPVIFHSKSLWSSSVYKK